MEEEFDEEDIETGIIPTGPEKYVESSLEDILETRNRVNKDFPSPSDNKIFKSRWERYIVDITDRENFKEGHVFQLEILCRLYVELDTLNEIISNLGYTYVSRGRNGDQVKPRPEIALQARALAEIRNYSKMLGLLLAKDTKIQKEEDEEDWD